MAVFKRTFSKCLFLVSNYIYVTREVPLTVSTRSMAGHSKWANIKFKKMHRDIVRAKILGRLHKEIVTAVRGKVSIL